MTELAPAAHIQNPASTGDSAPFNSLTPADEKPAFTTAESSDGENNSYLDEEKKAGGDEIDVRSVAASDILADGTERPIETAHVRYLSYLPTPHLSYSSAFQR
jgi:hypothetical protein